MKNDIILVGAFHEMTELCEDCGFRIVGIIDNNLSGKYEGYDIIGKDEDCHDIFRKYGGTPVVLTPDQSAVRMKLYNIYKEAGFSFQTVVSKKARISKSAKIGMGVVIQDLVNVSSHTVIGDFVKLNTMANVMHDCNIGSFTTIAPSAVVLGRITIGESCYIGANATVLPDVNIDGNTIVGAGATVLRDLNEKGVYIGTPARFLKKK